MIDLDNHGRFLLLGSVLVGMHFSIVSRNNVSQFDLEEVGHSKCHAAITDLSCDE